MIKENKNVLVTGSAGFIGYHLAKLLLTKGYNVIGIDALTDHLLEQMGYIDTGEGVFTARRRHVESLSAALSSVEAGKGQLQRFGSGELLAEDLRLAQNKLSEITGVFTSDALLGHIFSSFCIGK